jgi:isoaspartyl peptidase/L-asparaginase-like protein (Ntn-hydrolase superfamily)
LRRSHFGAAAEEFGREHGLEIVPQSYFLTEKRLRHLHSAKQEQALLRQQLQQQKQQPKEQPEVVKLDNDEYLGEDPSEEAKGTVGCVALGMRVHLNGQINLICT